MFSNILDRISFWSLFCVIVLTPLFVIPFTRIPIENAKSFLLVLGLAVSVISWAAARFSDGKIILPKSWTLVSGGAIVVTFLISALLSSVPRFSMFGVMMDLSTFWFIFASFFVMFVSSVVVRDEKKARTLLFGLLGSFTFILFFQVLRFIIPNILSLGVLDGKTSNLFGSWNSLGVLAGLTNIVSLFAIEFLHISRRTKLMLGILVVFSTLMAIIINFPLVWKLLGVFALIIFVYKISLNANKSNEERKAYFPTFSFAVVMVSLLFFLSGQFIGGFLPEKIGTIDVEVSPTFSSTMSVAKATLKEDPLFGIGPNRFSEAWALYKPEVINTTIFWDSTFNSGSGLIPTLAVTTGAFGVVAWLTFLILFLLSGVRMLFVTIRRKVSYESSVFFLVAVYMLITLFFYSGGVGVFLLAFALSGIFLGLYTSINERKQEIHLSFLDDPRKSFFSILFLVLLIVASAGITFKFMERFASVYYYSKTISTEDIKVAESAISKAISLNPNDLYFRTYSNVHLAKLSSLVYKEGDLTDQEKEQVKQSLTETVNGAKLATEYNKNNYLNFQALGSVNYATGLLGASGAFDSAVEAYQSASALNPLNPGIKLSIANSYLASERTKEARDFATEALKLKPNYIDALIIMSKIEKKDGNTAQAISYAEQALSFYPEDKDLQAFVNSIKGTSVPAPVNPTEVKQ